MLKFILFETGGVQLAVERQRIAHIQSADCLAISASARPGLDEIHYQGRTMPLIDLGKMLDRVAPAKHASGAEVLMTNGGSAVAVWADEVKEVVDIQEDQLDQLPLVFNSPSRKFFPYILRRKGQLTLVIDPEALEGCQCDLSRAGQQSGEHNVCKPARGYPAAPVQTDFLGPADQTAKRIQAISPQKLEAIILKKIKQYIVQRIQAMVAQNLAAALNRQNGQFNALLQSERSATAAR